MRASSSSISTTARSKVKRKPLGPVASTRASPPPLMPLAPPPKHHRHQIYAIPVRTFGCRAANTAGRVNPKLVRLHIAWCMRIRGKQLLRQLRQLGNQLHPHCLRAGGFQHGCKPALHAAVQGVVFDRLPVRAVWHLHHRAFGHRETGMAAKAVAPTIFEELIGGQRLPSRD